MKYRKENIQEMRILADIFKRDHPDEIVYGFTVPEFDERVRLMESQAAVVEQKQREESSELQKRELLYDAFMELRVGAINHIKATPRLGGPNSPILRELGRKTRLDILGRGPAKWDMDYEDALQNLPAPEEATAMEETTTTPPPTGVYPGN